MTPVLSFLMMTAALAYGAAMGAKQRKRAAAARAAKTAREASASAEAGQAAGPEAVGSKPGTTE